MSIDANSIAATVLEGVAEKSPEEAHAMAGGGGTAEFCRIWPRAKPILEFLAGVVVFIPGAGAVAGGVLTGLIKVGDQVAAQLCG